MPADARSPVSASLDVMLTDAVIDRGPARRFLEPASAVKVAAGLARHPNRMARRLGGLGLELGRAASGRSQQQPDRATAASATARGRRTAFLHGLLQGYLATVEAVDGLIADAGLDWRSERQRALRRRQRARRAGADELPVVPTRRCSRRRSIAAAPTWSRAPGGSCAMPRPTAALPAMVDTSRSRSAATSPSRRARSCCAPRCSSSSSTSRPPAKVHETPLLIVPPTINRYYIARPRAGPQPRRVPGGQGQQVF